MTTILPEKNKEELRKDYFLNFFRSVVWLAFFVCFIYIIFQITIYFSIKMEKDQSTKKFNDYDQKLRGSLIAEYREELSKVDSFLKKFDLQKQSYSEIINFVYNSKPETVVINSFAIESIDGGVSVMVSGLSTKREDLLVFSKTLEQSKNISDFDLPLSSFTKSKEIPFSLTFKYKKYEQR
jgi:hypothetical protein